MASRPVSILELVTLREYAPLDSLFRLLPKKAQRALTLTQSTIDVEWTCVDATSEFIALGSNISLIYLFDRQEQQLAKFKCEDKSSQVTCVKLLTCLDHQLAVGTSNGHVEIFLLPSRSHGHAVQAKRFVLENLHQTNPVTCIEWSNNGMKLFSGDSLGKVVQTDVDFYENECKASCVITEDESIVQLSYAHKKLLVSTTARTVVCCPGDSDKVTQVGQQPRKSKGGFGAHFVPGLCKPSDATMYVSRPGWRLWHANTEGGVLETIMFKDLVGSEHPSIRLLPDTPPEVVPPPTDLQLGVLQPFSHGLLVSWSVSSVVVLQPFGPEGALVVASNFGELGSVVSLAVTRHEIFVLRKGCDRCLVRIATAPEMQPTREPTKSERDFGRMQTIKLNLVGNSSQMVLTPSASVSTERMTSTKLKNKFNSVRGFLSKAADEFSDKALETKNKMEKNLERSFKLNLPIPERKSDDSASIKSDRSSMSGDDRSSTDPGTPEAMLSERLLVSVINASSMSGEQSQPAGRISPTVPFRSPANSFSIPAEGSSKASPVANGTEQERAADHPDEERPETEATPVEGSDTTSQDIAKESLTSSIEVTAMTSSKHKMDRVSVVITEDPGEDQSAQVVQNLDKRQSAVFKISKDTLQNIDTDFSDIVFQSKPKSKTKKKKKTIKGSKSESTIMETDPQRIAQEPGAHSSQDKDHVEPSAKGTLSLSTIQEGEAIEESTLVEHNHKDVDRTSVDMEKVIVPFERTLQQAPTEKMSFEKRVDFETDDPSSKQMPCEPILHYALETPGHPIPRSVKEESLNLDAGSSTPALSEYSLPRSLKSASDEMAKMKKGATYDSDINSFNGFLFSEPAGDNVPNVDEQDPYATGSPAAPVAKRGNRLNVADGKSMSISLPRSLHSNDLPTEDSGDLSPVVSPRSPRSPRGLEDEEGRQIRRLGVIMEDFDLDTVPKEAKVPSPVSSPVHALEKEGKDVVPAMPFRPPRKKNNHLGAVAALKAAESRPMSEFEDIYSNYRHTVIMMKESIDEEPPPPQTGKDELREASYSDNSETESHESDEGEEAEATLPESIQQKLAGSWMQCSTPNYICQLLASERHIWYVDSRYKAHHSLSTDITCKWSKLKDASSQQIAVSPSGGIVWRVHPKSGHASSSTAISQRNPIGYRWIEVSKDVSHVCLDENMAWIIKQNGQLCVHKGITTAKPYTKDTMIESNAHVVQIAANNNVVWARNVSDKVVYRVGITTKKPQGQRWVDLPDDENLRMVCIALDSRNTGWAIDSNGMVWFRTGVTKDKPMGDDQKWWQVCMSEYLMEDPNVLRMMVNMAGTATKVDRVVNWLKKQCYKATAIAANSSGVWVCSTYHYKTTLHVSRGNLLGSRWEVSNPIGLAALATWKCVCASPTYGPSGMIWALQTSGEIFCFSPESREPNIVQSPDGVFFEYISATTNAAWALSTRNEIYVRLDISDRCPGGAKWKRLDLTQFGNRHIVHFTLGNDAVWAVDSLGGIHLRIGVALPKYDALPLAWVPVDGKPVGYGVYFTHVFCNPGSNAVWAIDNKKTVYARQGVSKNMPVGLGWEPVEGTQANMLCMSADTVWALCPNGELACRFGISSENAAGDYWKKISGNFKYVTASQNDELWTINNDGRLFHRLTKMFIRSPTTKAAAMETTLTQGEDDWELL